MSGGYKDNDDNGATFVYTGAGGRDDKGKKQVTVIVHLYVVQVHRPEHRGQSQQGSRGSQIDVTIQG